MTYWRGVRGRAPWALLPGVIAGTVLLWLFDEDVVEAAVVGVAVVLMVAPLPYDRRQLPR